MMISASPCAGQGARVSPWTRRHRPLANLVTALRCLVLAAAVLFGLVAPSKAQDLVIAVSGTALSLPIIVADKQGYFAAEGIRVRLQECVGGHRCMKLLFDGQAQLATAADLPVMFNSFERSDYAVIATFVSSGRDLKLVTRKSAGITSAKQLEGKRVGTVKGASSQYFLDSNLIFNDVDAKKVTVMPLQPEQTVAALERKEVDALAIWEPYAYRAMKALGNDGVVLPSTRIYTQTFNLIATRRMIAEREGDLVKVLRAVERAQLLIREQPKQAQAILLAWLKLDPGFIEWIWSDFDYRMSLDQSLVTTLEAEARWAQREGHVDATKRIGNFLDFVHPAALRQAVPGAVTLMR